MQATKFDLVLRAIPPVSEFTINDIDGKLKDVSRATIANCLQKLSESGEIARKPDPNGGRAFIYSRITKTKLLPKNEVEKPTQRDSVAQIKDESDTPKESVVQVVKMNPEPAFGPVKDLRTAVRHLLSISIGDKTHNGLAQAVYSVAEASVESTFRTMQLENAIAEISRIAERSTDAQRSIEDIQIVVNRMANTTQN